MHSRLALRNGSTLLHAPTVVRKPSSCWRIDNASRTGRKDLHVSCALKASDLPVNLQKIVGAFQMVPDPMARYKQLLFYATKLTPLPAADHIPANKVEGCVSQVWVKPELREDGKVYWQADSDSQLTKGLAALLVTGLSGCTPEEICRLDAGFIEMLELKQSLTPSRNNGFLNMLRLMQRKSVEVMQRQALEHSAAAPAVEPETGNGAEAANGNGSSTAAQPSGQRESASSAAAASASSRTPVQDGVRRKLTEALHPTQLLIVDDSQKHAGHNAMTAMRAASTGGTGETHFNVEVVSAEFEGMPLVKRHRLIYQLLQEELGTMGLHALSLDTKAPSEVK